MVWPVTKFLRLPDPQVFGQHIKSQLYNRMRLRVEWRFASKYFVLNAMQAIAPEGCVATGKR